MSILVVAEQRGGAWNRMSWETVAAAQQIGKELGQPVEAAVIGKGIAGLAAELAGKQLARKQLTGKQLAFCRRTRYLSCGRDRCLVR